MAPYSYILEDHNLQHFHGTLSILGEALNTIVSSLSLPIPLRGTKTKPHHLPLVSEAELTRLSPSQIDSIFSSFSSPSLLVIGLGHSDNYYHVVLICPALQQLRKSVGLPATDLYIPLSGVAQDTGIPRGIESIPPENLSLPQEPEFLDQLTFTLHLLQRYDKALDISVLLVLADPKSHKGFIRVADIAFQLGMFKLAMLAYACAIQGLTGFDTQKVYQYAMKKLVSCSRNTEWGCTFLEVEIGQIPSSLRHLLLQPWSQDLRQAVRDTYPTPELCLESRSRVLIPRRPTSPNPDDQFTQLPRFFRWLVPFEIAIMSTPRNAEDIAAIASRELGIRNVLTLMQEKPLPASWFNVRHRKIGHFHIPIPNYHPPTIEQMDLIIQIMGNPENRPILIHCGAGKGRAGTAAACYLAAYGFRIPEMANSQEEPALSSQDAISALRRIRPGSLETREQEKFVSTWVSTVWRRRSILPIQEVFEPPPCPFEIVEGSLDAEKDNLFILVGLPGSGKSWFSKALKSRNPRGWKIVCQDDNGSKHLSETEMGVDPQKASSQSKRPIRVILDKCNTSSVSRRTWHSLASNWVRRTVCVWFDYPDNLCLSRAQSRTNHPTLPAGPRVHAAMKQFQHQFVAPTDGQDPYFSAIVRIRSFAAANDLIQLLSPPTALYKYPRTPHLINLGAVAGDDIVTSSRATLYLPTGQNNNTATATTLHTVITEKIDGANLGFSLNSDRQVLVQNRSHYVNPSSHPQFKHLGLWIEKHREELYKILDRDNDYFPERFVLFGEWLYATHSIHYEQLPDWFMAFDLYDRSTESWVDRSALLSLLADTTIHPVRTVYEGYSLPSEEQLIQMTQNKSPFYDGKVEGVYVHLERGGKVVERGKVVRGDFISGDEHWTRGKLRANELKEPPS